MLVNNAPSGLVGIFTPLTTSDFVSSRSNGIKVNLNCSPANDVNFNYRVTWVRNTSVDS